MKARIAVCTPCYGNPEASRPTVSYTGAMYVLAKELDVLCGEQGWDSADVELEIGTGGLCFYPESQEHARNNLAGLFLENPRKYTHALLWDSDEKGTPRQLWTIISNMLKADYSIMSVPCPEKHYLWKKAAKALMSIRGREFTEESLADFIRGNALRYVPNPKMVSLGPLLPDGFAEIKKGFATLGFAMIKRHVFEQMTDAYRDALTYRWTSEDGKPIERVGIFHTTLGDRVFESEDLAFCSRWRALGGTMHLYLGEGAPLDHIGYQSFNGTREALLSDYGFSR